MADWLIAWGTVGLAFVTVAGLAATMFLAHRDRKDAERRFREEAVRSERQLQEERERAAGERADAELRFRDEVERSERQVREEREFAERARRRERQIDNAARLMARIAPVIPCLDIVPGVALAKFTPQGQPTWTRRQAECWEAVRSLRHGGDAEVAGLGDVRAAGQYRQLVFLVQSAALGEVEGVKPEKVSKNLRRYAHFVRVSLGNLVEHGESLDPGRPEFPRLGVQPGDASLWSPERPPPAWLDAIRTDPDDPMYGPAS